MLTCWTSDRLLRRWCKDSLLLSCIAAEERSSSSYDHYNCCKASAYMSCCVAATKLSCWYTVLQLCSIAVYVLLTGRCKVLQILCIVVSSTWLCFGGSEMSYLHESRAKQLILNDKTLLLLSSYCGMEKSWKAPPLRAAKLLVRYATDQNNSLLLLI